MNHFALTSDEIGAILIFIALWAAVRINVYISIGKRNRKYENINIQMPQQKRHDEQEN